MRDARPDLAPPCSRCDEGSRSRRNPCSEGGQDLISTRTGSRMASRRAEWEACNVILQAGRWVRLAAADSPPE